MPQVHREFSVTRRRVCVLLALCVAGASHAAAPTRQFDLQTATIADINAAIDAGALTSEKLLDLYLKRIEAYDKKGPKINSVITMNPQARAEARAMDAERKAKGRRSPLHGIPVVIKDLIDMAGLPTSAGFKPFGFPIPEKDAALVARIREAGGVIVAKVATVNWFGRDEFGPTHPIGATLNPYNAAYSPGGSSNGTGRVDGLVVRSRRCGHRYRWFGAEPFCEQQPVRHGAHARSHQPHRHRAARTHT